MTIYWDYMPQRQEFSNVAAFGVARCAELLQLPSHLAADALGYALRRYDFQLSGLGSRVAYVALVVFSTPYHLTFGLIAWGLSSVGGLGRRQFCQITPQSPNAASFDKLTICTFNTALLSDLINGLKGSIDYAHYFPIPGGISDRVDRVAQAVLSTGADVVCLQEVFHDSGARKLSSELAEHYPYQVRQVAASSLKQSSGLMILSKAPIESVSFHLFEQHTGADSFANKGTLAVTLDLGRNKKLQVLTTHMNSDVKIHGGTAGGASQVRKQQLEQISRLVSSSQPAVVLGDMNHRDPNLEGLTRLAKPEGSNSADDWNQIDHIFHSELVTVEQGSHCVDHSVDEPEEGNPASDHAPVKVTLRP